MIAGAASAATPSASLAFARDVLALTKPGLSSLVVMTTGIGVWLARGGAFGWRDLGVVVATAALVGAANIMNAYLERDSDRLMSRTAARPLAAGRMAPRVGLGLGISGAALSVPALAVVGTPLAAGLGLVAYLAYVVVYTPLKRRTSFALLIGAVPGAIPPAIGVTAVSGRLDPLAFALFALLFVWQLPHFLAISVYLEDDYKKAGHKVFAVVHGARAALLLMAACALVLAPLAFAFVPLGVAGRTYGALSLLLSSAFFGVSVVAVVAKDRARSARIVFFSSLVYLALLLVALAADAT